MPVRFCEVSVHQVYWQVESNCCRPILDVKRSVRLKYVLGMCPIYFCVHRYDCVRKLKSPDGKGGEKPDEDKEKSLLVVVRVLMNFHVNDGTLEPLRSLHSPRGETETPLWGIPYPQLLLERPHVNSRKKKC